MIKIKILSIGKTKETWLENALLEYIKRLQGRACIEFILLKDNESLIRASQKENKKIVLSPEGKLFTSEAFSLFLEKKLQDEGLKLAFLIGGAEGLPEILKQNEMISLSPMTFTHQMTRLILVEQIYRALEISKGSGYHK